MYLAQTQFIYFIDNPLSSSDNKKMSQLFFYKKYLVDSQVTILNTEINFSNVR